MKMERRPRPPLASPPPSTTEDSNAGMSPSEVALWEKFKGLPPIPGLSGNTLCVYNGDRSPQTQSNPPAKVAIAFETEFGVEVCRYLLHSGVVKIALICNINGEARIIQKVFEERSLDPNFKANVLTKQTSADVYEVTVVVLAAAQGRYQQMKMFRLVQDALANSKIGVILLADISVTCDITDPKWHALTHHLKKEDLWKNNLELVCLQHDFKNSAIFSAADLKRASPFGGCGNFCGRMECSHVCPYVCHPLDPAHSTPKFRCNMPCERKCPSGHKCKLACWEDCGKCLHVVSMQISCSHQNLSWQAFCWEKSKRECQVPVKKELPCGHTAVMCCSEDLNAYICDYPTTRLLPCGHVFQCKCSENPVEPKCLVPIMKEFDCRHKLVMTCYNHLAKSESGTLQCNWKCLKRLECGHQCSLSCHIEDRDHVKYKCMEPCQKYCGRGAHKCVAGDHLCWEPCKPCVEPHAFKLACSHDKVILCSDPDPDENTYLCMRRCMRDRPFCGHACQKFCYEDCGMCEELVDIIPAGCYRRHTVRRKCSEGVLRCEVKMEAAEKAFCGHTIEVPCFEADLLSPSELSLLCEAPCSTGFDGEDECGHKCSGSCQNCYQGRFHSRCTTSCNKLLICGHNCPNNCSLVCRPCSHPCENCCEHKECEFECGVPCILDCKEPCSYVCDHSKCTKKCSEVCNKPPCFQPCPYLIKCGHPCVGYCGEICPPHCRVCNPDELSVGVFSEDVEVDCKYRYIYLPECGHSIEAENLEIWIKSSMSSQEVLPLRCPICRTRMKWVHRFSSFFHENFKLIDTVREKIFGSQEEIDELLIDVETKVKTYMNANTRPIGESDYARAILEELGTRRVIHANKKCSEFESMDVQKARFLKWIADEYIDVSEIMKEHYGLPAPVFAKFESHWEEYLTMMFDGPDSEDCRYWPLHPNEMNDAQRERRRLNDSLLLYPRLLRTVPQHIQDLLNTSIGRRMFSRTEAALWINRSYTEAVRKLFFERLDDLDSALRYTLNVTEKERQEIVSAFGERSGRWFKCANGHIYVVTECGGVTEVGMCNECGAPIGGENHRLLEKNYLSTEMDDAEEPLYPTVLDRGSGSGEQR